MPVFIKLTSLNGNEIWINASKIDCFYKAYDGDCTAIEFSGDEVHVKETPGEIMNKIGMASTIETETTIYTDDSNRPEIYTL